MRAACVGVLLLVARSAAAEPRFEATLAPDADLRRLEGVTLVSGGLDVGLGRSTEDLALAFDLTLTTGRSSQELPVFDTMLRLRTDVPRGRFRVGASVGLDLLAVGTPKLDGNQTGILGAGLVVEPHASVDLLRWTGGELFAEACVLAGVVMNGGAFEWSAGARVGVRLRRVR